MYSVQISDRDTFAKKAKSSRAQVAVVRSATVVPVRKAGAVVMHPALTIDYAMDFQDPSMGATRWTFREVVLTNARGDALLTESLWFKLMADSPESVQVVHRSGSL